MVPPLAATKKDHSWGGKLAEGTGAQQRTTFVEGGARPELGKGGIGEERLKVQSPSPLGIALISFTSLRGITSGAF